MTHSSKSVFVHKTADVISQNIGEETRIWQYSVVLAGAVIGSNCNICSHCFIENDVKIGNNVTIKFHVEVCDGVEIEDDVFIGPSVVFTNDASPRSKAYPEQFLRTKLKRGASIGANVTLLPGIEIGCYAFVAAGSVVTRSVPDFAMVVGSPAKIVGWVDKDCKRLEKVGDFFVSSAGEKFKVENNQLIAQ